MRSKKTRFVRVQLSLKDIAGDAYAAALVDAYAALRFVGVSRAGVLARKVFRQQVAQRIDFFPAAFQQQLLELLPKVGTAVAKPLAESAAGAGTHGFSTATKTHHAPLSGMGFYRVAENGVLYFTAKSEHYHAPLGHSFPGYDLIKIAHHLGVPNATHNNSRGHLTRLLEEALVRAAAGMGPDDARYARLMSAKSPATPNRVLNLETGSLAAEAALKMALARFYKPQADSPVPRYQGRIPVLVVIGDVDGGLNANYHGTTMLTQLMRGMWNDLREGMERQHLYVIRSVRPNDRAELDRIFSEYNTGKHKIAAVFHEIVLMNYAGKLLDKRFVRHLYRLAAKHDVPTVVDEIQTGIWSPELFMFREYGVKPTFVAIGKGFPGGEYCASRILFSSEYDTLPQFGALVTNGQEELASLAYLVTMRWAQANAHVTSEVGEYYEQRLRELAARHKDKIAAIEGRRHLAGVYFHELPPARAFAESLNRCGVDISVQTYKAGCPPSALTKLPLIAGYEAVDLLISCMGDALK